MSAVNTLTTVMPLRQWLSFGLNLTVTLVAAWYSFSFGQLTGGPFMGTVAAINGGAMASLLTSALLGWRWRAFIRSHRNRSG
jgi:hypothetical protein